MPTPALTSIPQPTPRSAGIGTPVIGARGQWELTVSSVEYREFISFADMTERAYWGGIFLIVEFSLRSLGEATSDALHLEWFQVTSQEGYTYHTVAMTHSDRFDAVSRREAGSMTHPEPRAELGKLVAFYVPMSEVHLLFEFNGDLDRFGPVSLRGPFGATAIEPSMSSLTADVLRNAEYVLGPRGDPIRLTDGYYSKKVPDRPLFVWMTQHVAYGRSHDGQEMAAVVLLANYGGSGHFYYLATVVDQGGKPVNVAIAELGDRVKVRSLFMEDDEIIVHMLTHRPMESACCPSLHVVHRYAVQDDKLVQVPE